MSILIDTDMETIDCNPQSSQKLSYTNVLIENLQQARHYRLLVWRIAWFVVRIICLQIIQLLLESYLQLEILSIRLVDNIVNESFLRNLRDGFRLHSNVLILFKSHVHSGGVVSSNGRLQGRLEVSRGFGGRQFKKECFPVSTISRRLVKEAVKEGRLSRRVL
ncbi:hypothetical protein EUTSA_v10011836mg [Eutrema salsugineum]|uniref:Uncharacterized protein n=1 Tax=Eutrema salsugineum TaxID=72664 RepID=V4KUI0_EUTSA|nr:hypothetical protein EUTSA_v10011836mg [Eutrema salsugineum]